MLNTAKPKTLADTGLREELLQSLLLKQLVTNGVLDLAELAAAMCLPGQIVEAIAAPLRKDGMLELLAPKGGTGPSRFNLTERGRNAAGAALMRSGYVGPTPISLAHWTALVDQQSVHRQKVTRESLTATLEGVVLDERKRAQLGPALNSGRAILVYGPAGTGKTFICKRVLPALGGQILMPHAIAVGDEIVGLFDPSLHEPVHRETATSLSLDEGVDPRLIECQRPVAITGGELTLDMLEIDYDANNRQSNMPVHAKATNGMFIIDDLGRQRTPVAEIFNRWIVPLEEQVDYLTLGSGRRFRMPFDMVLIFSSNLDPADLADDAFLRRIGYKIAFSPITEPEFQVIWDEVCAVRDINCPPAMVDAVLARYRAEGRDLIPCQPRDLLGLIADQCTYQGQAAEVTHDLLDLAWQSYFIERR